MKKSLLLALALGATLSVGAEVTYMPVTSTYQIVDGGKYVIAAYNHNWGSTDNQDKNIYILDGDNVKFVRPANATAENAIWTATINTETPCTRTDHKYAVSIFLSQNGKYAQSHTSGNVTTNTAVDNTNSATAKYEIVKVNAPSGGSADNTYFELHYNAPNYSYNVWVNNVTNIQMGFSSALNPAYQSGTGWSTYMVVYHVIENDEDLLVHANGELREYAESLSIDDSILRGTGLFSETELAELVASHSITDYALTSVSDYATEVAAKKAEMSTKGTDTFPFVKNKINGKKVYLRAQADGNDSYYGALHMAADGSLKHFTDLDVQGVWELSYKDDTHISLKNLAYNKYASALASSDTEFAYGFAFAVDNSGAFTLRNESQSGNSYLNKHQKNNIGYWTANTGNDGSFWKISLVDDETETELFDAVKEYITGVNALVVTDANPGSRIKNESAIAEAMTKAENLNYTNAAEILNGNYLSYRPVETGRYVRIINYGGNHALNVTASNDAHSSGFSTSKDDAIFYVTEGGHLIHHNHGVAVVCNERQLTHATTAEQNKNYAQLAAAINFVVVDRNNADIDGRFYLLYSGTGNNSSVTAVMYVDDNGTYGNGNLQAADNGNPNNNSALSNANWTFKIEYVNELPVAIGADGVGTLYCPVAVKANDIDNFDYYVASTNEEDKLVFTAATGTVPANSFLVIKAKNDGVGVCNVELDYEAENVAALAENITERFSGSYLALPAKAVGEGQALYAKSNTASANAGEVAFAKVEEGAVLAPGTLSFVAENDAKDGIAPATLNLKLTESNLSTTAISEIAVEAPAAGAIYDLQGRKLAAPVKGINIIGGKKMLVK